MKKLLSAMLALTICSPVLAETSSEKLQACLKDADIAEVISMKRQEGTPRQVITDMVLSSTPELAHAYFLAMVNMAYAEPIQVSEQAKNNINTDIRNRIMSICLEN
ncbi:hypothetical protein [Marinobacter sp. MMG032]|uniref:Uncharacterized protein n=1 Tax=Marinobacter sp. MMG032 TaxID=3158548 RepID=A0AAU7MPP1_9GAMM